MEDLLRGERRDQLVDHCAEMCLRLRWRPPMQFAVARAFEIVLDPCLVQHLGDHSNVAAAPEQERLDVAPVPGAAQPRPRAALRRMASRLPPYYCAIVYISRYR